MVGLEINTEHLHLNKCELEYEAEVLPNGPYSSVMVFQIGFGLLFTLST